MKGPANSPPPSHAPSKQFTRRFPDGWYEAFLQSLKINGDAKRIMKDFVPICDFYKIGKAAMLYVLHPMALNRSRKRRGKTVSSALRKRARKLSTKIADLQIPEAMTEFKDIESFLRS